MAEYDDGAYYEVQLNNKQLVFFFMATLAIAVVVFLCGVMVGRGVRDATLQAAQNNIAAAPASSAPQVQPATVTNEPALDYESRLESNQVENKLQSESPENTVDTARNRTNDAKPPAATAPPPAPPKPQPKPQPTRGAAPLGRATGNFTIQVVALKTEDAAEGLLDRLKRKNYRAYLEAGGESGLHRVRVGRFSTRAEAEIVAQKLRTEERFNPYITQ